MRLERVSGGMVALLAGLAWLAAPAELPAAPATISKVLVHLVDVDGQHTLSPSLYERDAYQGFLRSHPEQVGGVRFDVQWKVSRELAEGLRMRIELRGSRQAEVVTVERPVTRRRWYNRWSSILLDRETVESLGRVTAWRVSLWRGAGMLAEQRSFLW